MPLRRRGSQARLHPGRRSRLAPIAVSAGAGDASFERLVETALDSLPALARQLLEDVAIVIEDEPSAEQLRTSGLRPGDTLYGLYEGTPATLYASDSVPLPNKISIFRVPLEEDFLRPADLAHQVRTTVIHELAHHAGIEDDRLELLGLD